MRAGCRLLIAGLSLDLAGFVVGLFLFAFLMAAAAQDAGGQHLNPDDSPLGLGGVAVCAISIASGIFELVGLVWLLSMGRDLPLR